MPSRVEPHSGRVMELLWVQLRLFGGITEHDDRTDVPARICGEMGIYQTTIQLLSGGIRVSSGSTAILGTTSSSNRPQEWSVRKECAYGRRLGNNPGCD